jgi:hypothetical protein
MNIEIGSAKMRTFKITNTSKSSGTHQFEICLRGRYQSTIRSEQRLREVLLKSINAKAGQPIYRSWIDLYNSGDLLAIMREFGMVSTSRRLIK